MEFKNQKLEDFEKNLKFKKVAVIGLGVSNIPLIDYLYEKHAKTIKNCFFGFILLVVVIYITLAILGLV